MRGKGKQTWAKKVEIGELKSMVCSTMSTVFLKS